MAYKRNRTINMPAPYLRRIWLDPARIADRAAYPFCLPFLRDDFEQEFDRAITIIVGENGTGKSTFLEGIAVLSGYDEAGGGKGYRPVDHSDAARRWAANFPPRFARAGCPGLPMAGSSGPRVFSRSHGISTSVTEPLYDRISSRTPTAKDFCASSRSAASGRASSSSTSRNPRCRRRGRWNF